MDRLRRFPDEIGGTPANKGKEEKLTVVRMISVSMDLQRFLVRTEETKLEEKQLSPFYRVAVGWLVRFLEEGLSKEDPTYTGLVECMQVYEREHTQHTDAMKKIRDEKLEENTW